MSKQKIINTSRRKVYNAIIAFMMEHNYPPSVRDLCDITGLSSTSTIAMHLMHLKEDGAINYNESISRSITVPGIKYVKNNMA